MGFCEMNLASYEVEEAIRKGLCTFTYTGHHFHQQYWSVLFCLSQDFVQIIRFIFFTQTTSISVNTLKFCVFIRWRCITCELNVHEGVCLVCKEKCHKGHQFVSLEPNFSGFYW
jgi:hypothetical protein